MSDFKSIGGTVRARAASELRDRILTGRLRPGTRLDLDEITREFGTSRTPVREALLELSYEGLVTVTPRSGITVLGITPEDAVDNFAVLATLSGKAAEWATERITEPERDRSARPGAGRGARRGCGGRQLELPPGPQPAVGLAPAHDLPAPGRPGGAGQLLRTLPRAGPSEPGRPCRPARCHRPRRRRRRHGPSPSPTSSMPAPPWATGCGPRRRRAPVARVRRAGPDPATVGTGSGRRRPRPARARTRKPSSFSSAVRIRVLRDMVDTSWPTARRRSAPTVASSLAMREKGSNEYQRMAFSWVILRDVARRGRRSW